MGANVPLVARQTEMDVVRTAIAAAREGRGEAVLVTGEAGIGKTRLIDEARAGAEELGMLILKGRAVESGGAYRPLVEAFARPAVPFADDPALDGVRPVLARVLPGWRADETAFAPMADPAAVLAEALMVLLQAMAPSGALMTLDDLHWADPDTLSVLASIVDSVDRLPLALLLAAREEPELPVSMQRLEAARSVRRLHLKRLTPAQTREALTAAAQPELRADTMEECIQIVAGLPLILDELVRQLTAGDFPAGGFSLENSTLASATQMRLSDLSLEGRTVLNALSVLGDADLELLTAATSLDKRRISDGLHEGLVSTLLVPAPTPLGVGWRHRLIGDAVRALLLPLEQQAIAERGADDLAARVDPGDDLLHQAAVLYELARKPTRAAEELIRAAQIAVRRPALHLAEQYLAGAERLAGQMSATAQEVLIERLETLTLSGHARDAYISGQAALRSLDRRRARPLLLATARAAYSAGLLNDGARLRDELEQLGGAVDADLAALRATAALEERRRSEALALGETAASLALQEGRADLACEALIVSGTAASMTGKAVASELLGRALSLSRQHNLPVLYVRTLAELGMHGLMDKFDLAPLERARDHAAGAGMAGTVALLDFRLALVSTYRIGFVSAYPAFLRVDSQACQLRLTALHARIQTHFAECLVHADDRALPGESDPASPSAVNDTITRALALGEESRPVPWAKGILGIRAWSYGDDATAIRLIEESEGYVRDEIKPRLWFAAIQLVRVAMGAHPDEAFAPLDLIGPPVHRAAHLYGTALWQIRTGRSPVDSLAAAENDVRNAPFMRHLLRTIIAPAAFDGGAVAAEGWLREADAFCTEHGERAVQRRIRHSLALIGAKVPRTTGIIPPHLARLGITARETEILRLINAGLGNTEIAARLFISVRTVESHVSSMLQKTGAASRDQLPSTTEN